MPSLPEGGDVHGAEVGEVRQQIGEGRASTPEELQLVEMQLDAVKQSLPKTNDYLVRLLTLASSLAGGSLALLSDQLCHPAGRVGAGLLFAAAVVVAILGLRPRTVETRLGAVADYRDAVETTVNRKRCYQSWSLVLLAAGLIAAVLGAAAHAFFPDAPKPPQEVRLVQ